MAEMVAAASECSSGSLHQWPEAGLIERKEERADQLNEFVCTGLVNPDMPLIRYKVGDAGIFSDKACDCGRGLPVIKTIEGRSDDLLYAADGARVGRLDPVFKDAFGIAEAQIIQRGLRDINVKYVAGETFDNRVERKIADRIRQRMGDVNVHFESVPEITRTAAGKFRAVVCQLSAHERKMAANGTSDKQSPK
jgi:phenylacetate-CoA ligase